MFNFAIDENKLLKRFGTNLLSTFVVLKLTLGHKGIVQFSQVALGPQNSYKYVGDDLENAQLYMHSEFDNS